jgi:hypothetical protein
VLSRQSGQQSLVVVIALVTLHKRAHPTGGRDEVEAAEEGLQTLRETFATNDIKLLIHAAFSACAGIAMALVLMG